MRGGLRLILRGSGKRRRGDQIIGICGIHTVAGPFCFVQFQIKRGKNHEMEWWELSEEYNPGMSLWRGRKISDDTSSCESDIEIIAEKVASKDESIKVCRRNLFIINDVNP